MTNDSNGIPTVNGANGATDGSQSARGDAESLSTNAAFDLLSDHRRRYVVHRLTNENEAELADVAGEIAATETDGHGSETDVEQVLVSLYHTHLPKLAAANVIEYDGDRGTVSPSENVDRLKRYVDAIEV